GSAACVGGALHATVVVTGSEALNTDVQTTIVAAASTAPASAAGTARRRRNGRPRSSVALPSVISETTRPASRFVARDEFPSPLRCAPTLEGAGPSPIVRRVGNVTSAPGVGDDSQTILDNVRHRLHISG